MKKNIFLAVIFIALVIVSFLYIKDEKNEPQAPQNVVSETNLVPMINSIFDTNFPLKSLVIDNLEDEYIIKGTAKKSQISSFLGDFDISFLLEFLPEEFDVSMVIKINPEIDNFFITITKVTIESFSFDTNIILKM